VGCEVGIRLEWYSPDMTTASGTITVKLFAGLEARTRVRRLEERLTVAEAPTVGAVAVRLGLDAGLVGLVLVNGIHACDDRELADGDVVSLFPPLGGG
jgi:sulfur-carrier protein